MNWLAIYMGTLPADKSLWRLSDWFNYEVASRLVASYAGEKIFLIADESINSWFPENERVKQLSLGAYVPKGLSFYRQFNYKLPAALKKLNNPYLVSLAGVVPLESGNPAGLLLPDGIATIEKPSKEDMLARYRLRNLSRFLKNADRVAVLSSFTQKYVVSGYGTPEKKIHFIQRGIPSMFRPLDWETREKVKEQYTEGKEYLFYNGDIAKDSGVIQLLKAFTLLKKKMNSSMVLVLAGKQAASYKKFPKLMRTYHFRNDVKLTGEVSLEEIARLTGAAYASVFPNKKVSFCSAVPEALQCRTPAVVPEGTIHEEAGGKAVLTFKGGDFESLGFQLCELYRQEELRADLIARADEQVKTYNWDTTADQLMEFLPESTERTKK